MGTTERVAGWIKEARPELVISTWHPRQGKTPVLADQVFFAHCPERVLPGQILKELVGNDRVTGGLDRASALRCEHLYKKFVQGALLLTDSRTAELCKLCENAYRDHILLENKIIVDTRGVW